MENSKSRLEGVWVRYPALGDSLTDIQRWRRAEIREILEVLPSQYLIRDLEGEMELIPHERLNWSRLYPDLWSLANHYVQRPEDDPFTDRLDELDNFSHASWVASVLNDVERWLENPAAELECHGIERLLLEHGDTLRWLEGVDRIEFLMQHDTDKELGLDAEVLVGYHSWNMEKSRREGAGRS